LNPGMAPGWLMPGDLPKYFIEAAALLFSECVFFGRVICPCGATITAPTSIGVAAVATVADVIDVDSDVVIIVVVVDPVVDDDAPAHGRQPDQGRLELPFCVEPLETDLRLPTGVDA